MNSPCLFIETFLSLHQIKITMKSYKIFFLCLYVLTASVTFAKPISFKTTEAFFTIDDRAYFSSIKIKNTELLKGKDSPLLTACLDHKIILPQSMIYSNNVLKIKMADNHIIDIKAVSSRNCVTFEIINVPSIYEAVTFGPIKLNINDVVGEVIGVVQGNKLAFGIQALNIKTTPGIPLEYKDNYMKDFNYQGKGTETSTGGIPDYRQAAMKINEGSVFQFFCRNRSRLEYRRVQQLDSAMVEPVTGNDGIIKGAKIAIFGCRSDEALSYIGKIEIEQRLPHPILNGEWAKTARTAMKSYLITDFSESDLDYILGKAKTAGFKYIYEMDAFKDWGHFNWDKGFVNGDDNAVKGLVNKAASQGISIGVHTLSNFITPNDGYVSPVPSQHLLKQGIIILQKDIDVSQKEITIERSNLFKVPSTLNAIQLGSELITFGSFKENGNEILLSNCTRGAFNTKAQIHTVKEKCYKLWDYPYKTFFPDLTLQDAMVDRLVSAFNTTGINQTSFDGLEGCTYTGQEDYATARFVNRFYQGLNHYVINDASNLNHFTWHIHTRMNWGEPWGEAMRTAQVANRIKNQEFFKRNLFPRMLGWFLIRLADKKFECSSLEDLEWALAKSVGFDAGYGMTIDVNTMKRHGDIDNLLTAIKNWDVIRESLSVPEELREKMKDPKSEWHLMKQDDKTYLLYPITISKYYHCMLSELQPGQPGGADWSLELPLTQSNSIRLHVEGDGSIMNPKFTTSKGVLSYTCQLEAGQYLLIDNDGMAKVTDKNYNLISNVKPVGDIKSLSEESHVSFACDKGTSEQPDVSVRFISRQNPTIIKVK